MCVGLREGLQRRAASRRCGRHVRQRGQVSAGASEGAGEAGAWAEGGCGARLQGQSLRGLRVLRGRGAGEGKGGEPCVKTGREAGHGKARLEGPERSSEKDLQQTFGEPGCVFCIGSIEVN